MPPPRACGRGSSVSRKRMRYPDFAEALWARRAYFSARRSSEVLFVSSRMYVYAFSCQPRSLYMRHISVRYVSILAAPGLCERLHGNQSNHGSCVLGRPTPSSSRKGATLAAYALTPGLPPAETLGRQLTTLGEMPCSRIIV